MMDESELDRIAHEELLKEAKRGAERYSSMGPKGWEKPSSTKVNKRFFANSILQTLLDPNDSGVCTYRHKRKDDMQGNREASTGDVEARHGETTKTSSSEDSSCVNGLVTPHVTNLIDMPSGSTTCKHSVKKQRTT